MATGNAWVGTVASVLALVGGAACDEPATAARRAVGSEAAGAVDAAVDARPARAVIAAKRVEVPESCDVALGELRATVHRTFVNRVADTPSAVVLLRTMPAECRGASWYLAAAHLLRRWHEPIDIGGVELADPVQALELGLAAGDDMELFGIVALASSLGGAPALPDDACERAARVRLRRATTYAAVARNDGAHYICAHAALRRGDAARALDELDQLEGLGFRPDQEVVRARALIALGRADEAAAAIRRPRAVSDIGAAAYGVTTREGKLLDAEVARITGARQATR